MIKKGFLAVVLVMLVAAFAWAQEKKVEPENPVRVPCYKASGGPDGYGYYYKDSTETGGPTYSFIDVTTTGNALGVSDDGEANITTTNTYSFYGHQSQNIRIGNNGGILFNATSGDVLYNNACPLPSSLTAPAILPFWDDLDDETGDVYWQEFGSCPHPDYTGVPCVIIEWYMRPHYNGVGDSIFEVIIAQTPTEDVLFQYLDLDFGNASYDYGASATVGIDDSSTNSSYYLQYSCNSASLQNNFAIRFRTPVELMSFSVE